MATEKYTTLGESTLASPYTAGAASITVSSASSFPTDPNFRVQMIDIGQTTGPVYKITAVAGAVFTTTLESGSDASMSAGAAVVEVVTAAALDAIRSDINLIDTYANRPSSAVAKKGDRFKASDGYYDWYFDGAAWVAYFHGVRCKPPVLGDFTWINQNDATATQDADAIIMKVPVNASANARLFAVTPTAPWTATALVVSNRWITPYSMAGLGVHDTISSGWNGHMYRWANQDLALLQGTTLTSGFGEVDPVQTGPQYMWSRIVDDNTNLYYYQSTDGRNWNLMLSRSRTTAPLTNGPNRVGILMGAPGSANLPENWLTFLSWELT